MWTGLIFTVPILLISITAVMIAHHKGLGTKKIAVNAGWLPGYGVDSEKDLAHYVDDIKAFKTLNNTHYYGTKLGVLYSTGDQNIHLVNGTEGMEIRDLQVYENQLFIAGKNGIYKLTGSKAAMLKEGDFHGIDADNNRLIASGGKNGFFTSTDLGETWSKPQRISEITQASSLATLSRTVKDEAYMEKLNLEKLALDIHTGKAFFGEGAMWIWIDLIAISFLVMTITGIYMWYKRKYGKKKTASLKQTLPLQKQYIKKKRDFATLSR